MYEYNEDELWNFVYRANTPEKIEVAERWLMKHVDDERLLQNLLQQLAWQFNDLA